MQQRNVQNLSIAISAGGLNSRMGCDKASLIFQGKALLQRIIERLSFLSDEIIVSTHEEKSYSFLENIHVDSNIRFVTDIYTEHSSLGGIYTALSNASNSFVAIAACDMPFVSAALFQAEFDLLVRSNADIALPITEHGFEPFHAVYKRESCLGVAEKLLEQGVYKVSALFDCLKILQITPEMYKRAGVTLDTFINFNYPEDIK